MYRYLYYQLQCRVLPELNMILHHYDFTWLDTVQHYYNKDLYELY